MDSLPHILSHLGRLAAVSLLLPLLYLCWTFRVSWKKAVSVFLLVIIPNGMSYFDSSEALLPGTGVLSNLDNFAHSRAFTTSLWVRLSSSSAHSISKNLNPVIGIQADHPSNLITIDKDYLDRIETRRNIIQEQGRRVHGCLPSGDAAVRELYAFLMQTYLPKQYPTLFKLSPDGKSIVNSATASEFPVEWLDSDPNGALRTLAETVEEDMFLLHETDDGHFSDAFVCCFPSGFDPSQKLGKLLKDIHGPVPAYEKIGASMERFFKKLEVGKNVKRTNVSLCLPVLSQLSCARHVLIVISSDSGLCRLMHDFSRLKAIISPMRTRAYSPSKTWYPKT